MESKEMIIDNMEIEQNNSEKGVTTVEYAVMLVLVAIAVLAFGKGIAGSVTGVFNNLIANLK